MTSDAANTANAQDAIDEVINLLDTLEDVLGDLRRKAREIKDDPRTQGTTDAE